MMMFWLKNDHRWFWPKQIQSKISKDSLLYKRQNIHMLLIMNCNKYTNLSKNRRFIKIIGIRAIQHQSQISHKMCEIMVDIYKEEMVD